MADIVAIHGIFMNRSSRTSMEESWRTAMVSGLRNVRSPHAESLSVECAFYGHEYNDGKAYNEPEYAAIDLLPGFETELVLAIGAALDEGADSGDEAKLYLPGAVQRVLAAIERSNLFDGRDSFLISFVKQVSRYLSDPEFRARVHREMTAAMAQSPRLVIGHSLGSIIAYEWLRENEPAQPPALVSIGSPLGLEAIRRWLRASGGPPGWPAHVRSWTNIAARHDAVAMVKQLAPLYSPDIRDLPCDTPRGSVHAALSYLVNVQTARAVDKALA